MCGVLARTLRSSNLTSAGVATSNGKRNVEVVGFVGFAPRFWSVFTAQNLRTRAEHPAELIPGNLFGGRCRYNNGGVVAYAKAGSFSQNRNFPPVSRAE